MSSGKPNWQKLHELGKLPKGARGNVPMLALLDEAEKRIKELEAKIAELRAGGDSSEGPKRGPGRPPKAKLEDSKDEVE